MDHRDATAYLDRLGLAAEPPSAAALARLHRAHVERIPYETFWIHLREGWGIGSAESARRFARTRRGGYCFQHNGALALLLEHLGYPVTRHVAGVHSAATPTSVELGNHVALIVAGCPSEAAPDGRWYVDAGLGDALHEPLPLQPGINPQGPMRFGMARVAAGGVGDWHVTGDAGTFAGVSIVERPVGMRAFVARHRYNATSPASSFARTVTAQLRLADGTSVLRGCVHARTVGDVVTTHTCRTQAEWQELLADEFGLTFDVPLDAVWTAAVAAHETWAAARSA